MSYWKNKVVPKFKKLFDKSKKKSASETCKSFDSSKESLDKDIEEKRSDLQPKVVEIYRNTTAISKKLLKEPSESVVKENPDAAQSMLSDLGKAGFPQAQFLYDAAAKSGPALLTGPIVYLFQKTSTFLVDEPLPEMPNETREIDIESGAPKIEESEETEAVAQFGSGMPPPTEKVELSEDKKGKVPVDAKEGGAALEVKKDEIDAVEAKKEVVAQVEAEVETVKPTVVATAEGPPAKEETKEVARVEKENKDESAKATLSESKKEIAPKIEEKKENPAETPSSAGET